MVQSTKSFEAEELENSFPMDMGRRFREPESQPLLIEIMEGMRSQERRKRKRSAEAEQKWKVSVEALLANLVAAHLNVIDRNRYVAVSFNRNDYNRTEISLLALTSCRDYLVKEGLIDVAPGFHRWDADGIGTFGRRTRLRATATLRERIDRCELTVTSLARPPQQLIQIKKAGRSPWPAPRDVEDSRALLTAINARLAATAIGLDKAWDILLKHIVAEDEGEEADANYRKRCYAGDLSATSLYRVFKYNWHSGGRIYGGWWMSLPRAIRPYLTINGSPVVELDYKTLHPRLLYLLEKAPMPDDPYCSRPWCIPEWHALGKRTFNRLLNRRESDPDKRLKMRAARGDKNVLKDEPFREYLSSMIYRLSAISDWFGTGVGIRLQYKDSLLALRVLRSMEEEGIAVLPIHDSFIVAEKHEDRLHAAMVAAFQSYGVVPEIARKGPQFIQRSSAEIAPSDDIEFI